MSLFIWAVALFGMSPVLAATNSGTRAASSVDLTGAPATRTRTNVNYQKYETRTSRKTYDSKDAKNLYYTQPSNRSALYKQYDNSRKGTTVENKNVRTTRAETYRSQLKRKYYLAHPFFQPLKGKFGSVTDIAYTMNSYDFTVNQTVADPTNGLLALNGVKGKWNTNQISVKEDFSYGITDRIAIIGMLRYDVSEYKFDWKDFPDDKMDDNGLNLYGLGAQWRFLDNDKWIATLSGYFQHQKDIANSFILDLKGGYKVSSSTIYGLVRGWYVDFDGNSYGNGVEGTDADGNYAAMYIPYAVDTSSAFYVEGGLGVFSVLDEDWTLNVEALFGTYDWHNQASLKAAIGWQPNDWVALNLYAKAAVYDSADGKNLDLYWSEPSVGFNGLTYIGTTDLDKYSEMSFGLQAIFTF